MSRTLIDKEDLLQIIEPDLTWDMLRRINELPTFEEDDWTPITENQPANNQDVMFYLNGGMFHQLYWYEQGYWTNDKYGGRAHLLRDDGDIANLRVVAWMPLKECTLE